MRSKPKSEQGNAPLEPPLVSVIIPTYNDSATLREAIDSALNQTYPAIEVIVLDDGSDDGGRTKQLAAEYGDRIVFHSEKNHGVAYARNTGIDLAKGKYLAFLDADDLFYPDKIEKQVRFMQQKSLYFCHSSYDKVSFSGDRIGLKDTSFNSGNNYPQIIKKCQIATPTVMIQKDKLGNARFCEAMTIGEDTCLWIDLAEKLELGHIPEALAAVRVGEDSAANHSKKFMLGMTNIIQHMLENEHHAEHPREIKRLVTYLTQAAREAALNQRIAQGSKGARITLRVWHLARSARAFAAALYRKYVVALRRIPRRQSKAD